MKKTLAAMVIIGLVGCLTPTEINKNSKPESPISLKKTLVEMSKPEFEHYLLKISELADGFKRKLPLAQLMEVSFKAQGTKHENRFPIPKEYQIRSLYEKSKEEAESLDKLLLEMEQKGFKRNLLSQSGANLSRDYIDLCSSFLASYMKFVYLKTKERDKKPPQDRLNIFF